MIGHKKDRSTDTKSSRAKASSAGGKEPRPDRPGSQPPPDPPPQGTDQARHEAAQRAAHQAEALRKLAYPTYMASALALGQQIEPAGCRCYLEQLLKDSGNPQDPVERMFVEQLGLCHFRLGQLHAFAGPTKGIEATKILNGAAARLMGEFRRSALALAEYRRPKNQSSKLRLVKAL